MDVPRLIFVCRTCDRNGAVGETGLAAGEALACAIRYHLESNDALGSWTVREVACLNGCLKPCNAAFRGPGRFTYRFSRVVSADVDHILTFGVQYWDSSEGMVEYDQIPAALRAKMTVCTPPRGRWQ